MQRRTFLSACGAALAAGGRALAEEQPGQAKRFRVIDTHVHLFDARAMDAAGVAKIDYLNREATVEGCVEAMRLGDVDKGFLITYNAQDVAAQLRLYKIDPAAARLVYNTSYQKRAWKKHPELFYWFCDHIDPTRESYLEDLERDFDEGAAGIKMLPIFHGYFPDHPGYVPVYEMCRKRKKPIILDLSYWYLETMPPYNELEARRNRVKRWSDYARIIEPIFKQFSDVPISLAHAGTARRPSDYDEIFPFIAEQPNASCDIAAATLTSGVKTVDFIQQLVKAVGSHKVMYGTDWPYWTTGKDSYRKGTNRWSMITDDCPGFSDADKRSILAGNAETFVRFELPKAAAKRT